MHIFEYVYINIYIVWAIYNACLLLGRAFFQEDPRGAAREATRRVECPRAALRCHPCAFAKEHEHIPGDMSGLQVRPDV